MLQYTYQDESEFKSMNGYYSDGEYADVVRDEFERTNEGIYNSMSNANRRDSRAFLGKDGQTYQFSDKTSQNEDKVAYSQCNCEIYDMDGSSKTIDSIVSDIVKGESFVFACSLDIESIDEEFETDFLVWTREHSNVNKLMPSKGEEWVLRNEPTRDLILSFINKSSDEVRVNMNGCKIVDIIGDNTFVMFVESAEFIKEND